MGGFLFNGDATTYGVEFDGRLLITEQWVTGVSFSYAKGEWDSGATKPCNQREPGEVLGSCDIKGDPIGGEPELSLSLNSEYTWPLQSTEIYLRGLYKYTDERLNTEASAGIGAVRETFDAYSNFNLYAGWRSADDMWDVSVFAKNLLDDDTVIFQQGPDQYDIAIGALQLLGSRPAAAAPLLSSRGAALPGLFQHQYILKKRPRHFFPVPTVVGGEL